MMDVDSTPNRTPKYDANNAPKCKHQTTNALVNQNTPLRDTPPSRTKNRRPDMQLYVPKAKRGEPSVKPMLVESTLVSPAVSATPPAKIKSAAKTKRTSIDSRRPLRPTSKPATPVTNGGRIKNTTAIDSCPTASSDSDDRTSAPRTPADQSGSGAQRMPCVDAAADDKGAGITAQNRPTAPHNASPKIITPIPQSPFSDQSRANNEPLARASQTVERTIHDDRAATSVALKAEPPMNASDHDCVNSAGLGSKVRSGSDDLQDVIGSVRSISTSFGGGSGSVTEESIGTPHCQEGIAIETRTLNVTNVHVHTIDVNDGTSVSDGRLALEEHVKTCVVVGSTEPDVRCGAAGGCTDSVEVMEVVHSEDEVVRDPVRGDDRFNRVEGVDGVLEQLAIAGPYLPDGSWRCEQIRKSETGEKFSSPSGDRVMAAESSKVVAMVSTPAFSTASSAAVGGFSSVNECDEEDDEDDSWDAMYDENGDCLDPELEMQISKTFGQVSIQVPHLDYLAFKPKKLELSDEEYGHVIEIYDFPAEFKTQDLLSAFLKFQDKGFDIKWVDDTHALGVFASKIAAKDALAICHPFIKTRPLSQATSESRQKARRRSEFLQPYKARPQTTAAMARRLVSSALGLNLPVSKETREVERKKLLEAKERRKLAAKQKEAAWDGLIGSTE